MKDHEFLLWMHEHLATERGVDRDIGWMQKLRELILKSQYSMHELWTPEQVAERYGVSLDTLKNWRENKSGGPAFIKVARGAVRYRQEDLTTWEFLQTRGNAA